MNKKMREMHDSKKFLKILAFIISSVFIYLFLYRQVFKDHNIYSLIVYIIFLIIVLKVNVKHKRKSHSITIFILAIFLAIMYNLGYVINSNINNLDINVLSTLNIIDLIGSFSLLYIFLNYIYKLYIEMELQSNELKLSKKKAFFLSFIIILLCWLPFLLKYWPGIFSSDSIDQLRQALNYYGWSNHHPVTHTLFIKICYSLGNLLFNNSIKYAIIPIIQMIILDIIFSFNILYLNSKKINRYFTIITLLFYCLFPIFGLYSITIWKDVLFGGLVSIFVIQTYEITIREKLNKVNVITFIINALIISLIRNNAIYMIFLLILFAILFLKQNKKMVICSLCLVIVTYYIITIPIFNSLNISKSSISESMGIPLQQIARVIVKDGNINKNEKEIINQIIPLDTLKKVYNPKSVDPIKFNSQYNSAYMKENLREFIITWKNIFLKNKVIFIESYLYSTLGYWYPDANDIYLTTISYENEFFNQKNLYSNKIPTPINVKFATNNYINNSLWSMGTFVMLSLISTIMVVIKHGKKLLFAYAPIWGLWLTIMVAAPVYCDLRYVFFMYCAFPLIIGIPFIDIKIDKNSIKQ